MITKNIHKDIQETLKNRERALSRKTVSANTEQNPEGLLFEDIASRSTFITMVSNKDNPLRCEIIQGGDLSHFGPNGEQLVNSAFQPLRSTKFGYNEVYSKKSDGQIKPISGIKDISVEYKGGYKAIRKATVNWTASSLDDLDRLTPHFLSVGQGVLLEWGWVFKNSVLNSNIETFYKGIPKELGENVSGPLEHPINQEVFQSPSKLIYKNKGNHDAIGGVISNFDCKLNEDGGFDCTTIITSVGINLFENKRIDLDYNKLKIVTDSNGKKLSDLDDDNILNTIINLPRILCNYSRPKFMENQTKISLEKVFNRMLKYLGQVLLEENRPLLSAGEKDTIYSDVVITSLAVQMSKNKALLLIDRKQRYDVFVRWGWFEDNIISRYTAFKNNSDQLTNIFRSVETLMDDKGMPVFDEEGKNVLVDVKIRNDKDHLIPKDILKFILPGQSPNINSLGINFSNVDNNKVAKFRTTYNELINVNASIKSLCFRDVKGAGDNYGILRNVLINVKEIQKAFGIKFEKLGSSYVGNIIGTEIATPPENLKAAMTNLCNQFSENYQNYWNLQIVEDEFNKNIKIIDADSKNILGNKAYTRFAGDLTSESEELKPTIPSHKVEKLGLYKFPSFKLGSIVKNQNLSFKIPDAMAITTMYGSNKSKQNGLNTDTSQDGIGVEFLFAFDTDDDFKDKKFANMEYAHKASTQNSVGNSKIGSIANNRITSDGGFSLAADVGSTWWNVWSADEGESYKGDGIESTGSQNVEQKDPELEQRISEFRKEISEILQSYQEPLKSLDSEESSNERAVPTDSEQRKSIQDSLATTVNDETQVAVSRRDYGAEIKKAKESESEKLLSDTKYYQVEKSIDGSFDLSLFTAGSLIVKEKLLKVDSDKLEVQKDFLIPAELDLEIDGIGGIIPGNIINTDYIPKKYNEQMQTQGKPPEILGPRTYFQIFELTQTVGPDGWSTEISTKMRINTKTLSGLIEVQPPYVKPPKALIEPIKRQYKQPESNLDVDYIIDADIDPLGFDDLLDPDNELANLEGAPDLAGSAVIPDSSTAITTQAERDSLYSGNTRSNLSLGLDFKLTRPVFVPRKPIDESEMKFDPSLYELQDQSLVPKDIREDMKDTETDLDQKPMAELIEDIKDESLEEPKSEKDEPKEIEVDISPKEEITILQSTYKGTYEQNEVLYSVREDWRPLYLTGNSSAPLSGERINSDGTERTLVRASIPKAVRQEFFDRYIENPNKTGITKVNTTNYRFDATPIEKAGLLRTQRSIYWYGEFNPNY